MSQILEKEVIDLRQKVASLEEILKAQRKEIEKLQKAREQRDRLLALNWVCVAGLDGYFQQLHPAFVNLLGYGDRELLGQPFIEFVHPDDRATTVAAVTRLSEGSEVVGFENRYRCQDGSYRWLSWNAVSDRENQVIYATSRDVTQSKETQAKLEEQAQFLRSVYDGVEHLIFVLDVLENGEFRYVGWNSQTEKFTKIDSTEIAGKTPEDWLGSKAGRQIRQRLQACVETGEPLTLEECLVVAGEKTWWQTTFNPLRAPSGRIYRIVGTTFNISDLKRAEKILRRQALLLDQVQGSIISTDLNGTIATWSQGSKDLLGYSAAEAIGKHISLIYPEELHDFLLDGLLVPLQQQGQHKVESKLQRRSGEIFDSFVSLSLERDEEGKVIGMIGYSTDISDRKATEQALRESERKYQQILDAITDSVLVKGPQSRIVWANKPFREYYGMTNEQLENIIDADFNKPDYTLQYIKDDTYVFETGQTLEIEEPVTRYDGEVRFFNTIKSAIRNEEGEVILTVGVARDITERQAAQEALRQSEKRYQTLAEASPMGVFYTDVRGECRYVNQRWSDITGLSREAGLGTEWTGAIHPDDLESIDSEWQGSLAARQPLKTEYRLQHTDGKVVWALCQALPVMDATGELEGYVGTIVDISDRKHQEAALQEQARLSKFREAIYSTLAQCHSLPKMLQDCTEAIVTYLDAAFARIWILNENVLELQASAGMYTHLDGPHSRVPLGQSKIGLIAEKRQPHLTNSVATDPRVSDKEWVQREGMVAFAGYPLYVGQELLGVVALFARHPLSDSTLDELAFMAAEISLGLKRQQAEASLRRSETQLREQARQLERTLRELQRTQAQLIHSEKMSSLGQMVAGIAHEINNPISFIYGNVDHATDYFQDLFKLIETYQQSYPNPRSEVLETVAEIDLDYLVDDLSKLMGSMKSGAQRIRDIVLSLKNFSRLHESDMKPVDLHDGIESTLLIIQNRLSGAGIEVIKEYSQLPMVTCYASDFNQVLLHIFNNAIDALLMVETTSPQIIIRTEVTGYDRVKIAIADNGPGMSDEVRSRVFDPFFTTKPVGSGTGLGLAVSYQIVVEKHGGSLTCISVPGQGTEFIIEIPMGPTT